MRIDELFEAYDSTIAAEREMVSTPVGRQSNSLRRQARIWMDQGNHAGGFRLYQQALALHDHSDHGAEAAAARHDLGEAYRSRPVGSRLENLLSAERLLREAYASPRRKRDPLRLAGTARSLASTLRMQAVLPTGVKRRGALLEEARNLLRESNALLERGGELHALDIAHNLDTLSNLELQEGNTRIALKLAIEASAAAKRGYRKRRPMGQSSDTRLYWSFRLNEYRKRLYVGGKSEHRKIIKQLPTLIDQAPPAIRDNGRLTLALAMWRRNKKGERSRARALLRDIKEQGLDEPQFQKFINALIEAKMREVAIAVLERAAFSAIEHRVNTMADYLADHALYTAQTFALRAAKLRLKKGGDALPVFLLLENTAGLRFEEVYRRFRWRPQDAIAHRLAELLEAFKGLAVMADELAGNLAHAPGEAREGLNRELVEGFSSEAYRSDLARLPTRIRGEHDRFRASVLAALKSPDPSSAMRRYAETLFSTIHGLEARLRARDPTREPPPGQLGMSVTHEELTRLLKAAPDTAFLRVSVSDELIAVMVFKGEQTVESRVVQRRVHPSTVTALWKIRADPFEAAEADFDRTLASLELSPLFGAGLPSSVRNVVILPNDLAGLFPISSLGPRGQTLLDRFDSVTWLPLPRAPARVAKRRAAARGTRCCRSRRYTLCSVGVCQPTGARDRASGRGGDARPCSPARAYRMSSRSTRMGATRSFIRVWPSRAMKSSAVRTSRRIPGAGWSELSSGRARAAWTCQRIRELCARTKSTALMAASS